MEKSYGGVKNDMLYCENAKNINMRLTISVMLASHCPEVDSRWKHDDRNFTFGSDRETSRNS